MVKKKEASPQAKGRANKGSLEVALKKEDRLLKEAMATAKPGEKMKKKEYTAYTTAAKERAAKGKKLVNERKKISK